MNDAKYILWLTGLSASGKTTIAKLLLEKLIGKNLSAHHLDGDEVRAVQKDFLGYSKEGRDRNNMLAIEIAKKYQDEGKIVIASFISPYREHRQWGRDILEGYIEIYVEAPLEICEQRDPKGLYKKARAGELSQFTGIDDPYEAPETPDIHLPTHQMEIEECVEKIMGFLEEKGLLK
jgi:adenylyl-sulfate kinase